MPRSSPLLLAAVCTALFAGGCQCVGPSTQSRLAVINAEWEDQNGERQISREATYDFGSALIGQRKEKLLVLRNDGVATLRVSSFEHVRGDGVAAPGFRDDARAPFTVDFRTFELEPSARVELPMAFAPVDLQATYEAVFRVGTEGTREEDRFATITLKAAGEDGDCRIPDIIDFGNASLGDRFTYPITLNNPSTVPATATVGEITGQDVSAFGFELDGGVGPGEHVVAPTTQKQVLITFTATERREYRAQIELSGVGACPKKTVTIRGVGSDELLSWAPPALDFGFVNPSDEVVKEVIFRNPSGAPVTLTNVVSSLPQDFYHVVPANQSQATFTVAGGGESRMKIACSPTQFGPRTGTLTFRTPLSRLPSGTINLRCTGGGPRIRVSPRPAMAFGRVGFFPGMTTFNVTRRLLVQNVGSVSRLADGGVDVAANLYLGTVAMDGTPGQLPFFELTPRTNVAQGEFELTLASPYPTTGLEASSGRNTVDFAVKLTPQSMGRKEAELAVFSNDGSEPVIRLNLTADVQQLPPCNYSVTPMSLNFGLVTPGTSKDLPVVIKNLGTQPSDVCYLSGVDLRAGSHPAFSLVGGPIVELELQPQESRTIVVHAEPPGPVPTALTTVTGELTFNVTSPSAPQARVPITAAVGPSCLVAAPEPLDFGTVKTGCNSAPRTLSLYNSCSTDVYVQSISLLSAAGQPAGGPNCPGGMPCPEFRLVQTPSIPGPPGRLIAPAGAPVTMQLKYSPIDQGQDTGAIAISVLQSGQPATYLVSLRGNSDTTGIATDTFFQSGRPKADVLFVVDDSGSMSDKQMSLAMNFQSFIQYATAANVDYHLAVTTTSPYAINICVPGIGCGMQSEANGGRMARFPATATSPAMGPVVTPQTPNVNQVFARLVNVGPYGDSEEKGLQQAVLALTPPLIVGENAGFLRPDANLAVIIVSDAGDQSPQPVIYYQDRLINVKGPQRLSFFTFNLIGPLFGIPPDWCIYDGDPDPRRYREVARATGGIVTEICTQNWANTLQLLGRTTFGGQLQFFLNNLPDLAVAGRPVDVKINGVVVPATGWSYDSASNSIKFTMASKPQPGQTVTVTYPITCL